MDYQAECIIASNKKCEELISHVDSSDESDRKIDPEGTLNTVGHETIKISYSSEILSRPSSRSSSSEDLFQINPRIVIRPTTPHNNIPKPTTKVTKPLLKNEHVNLSSETICQLDESIDDSPQSNPRFSDVTYECLVPPHMSPTQSPSIQTMDRSRGFDPNRIPASVFNRSPASPMDWSVASNESLFSIHIGTNSFSRDFVSRLGAEAELYRFEEPPNKSGDLFTSENLSGDSSEVSISKELYKHDHVKRADELIRHPRQGVPTSKQVKLCIDEPIKGVPEIYRENPIDTKADKPKDLFIGNKFDETKMIIHSIEFEKKKSSCPLCCGCYREFKCCKCPSCSFKFSQCCCIWSSCSSVKCCKWSKCSCKWLPVFSWKWFSCSGSFSKFFSLPKCLRCSSCCKWRKCSCKWSSCNFNYPTWSSFCCKCPTLSNCCCKCPSWCRCSSYSCTCQSCSRCC